MKQIIALFLVLASLLVSGCVSTSEHMTRSVAPAPSPTPGKALVVFMRPSNYGGGIQASVYEASQPKEEFIGIVSANTKVAFQADPGEHLFMVIGENADFMNATLEAGKTYHVLVSPRMGVWKARFSLLPIHNDAAAKYSLKSTEFKKWESGTHFVEKSPAAEAWYRENAESVAAKRADYMEKWKQSSPIQQQELTLLASDGI